MLKIKTLSTAMLLLGLGSGVQALEIKGQVKSESGEAIQGALVSGSIEGFGRLTTYSDDAGFYQLKVDNAESTLDVRVRAPGYRDLKQQLTGTSDTAIAFNPVLSGQLSDQERSAQATASAHAANLKFSNKEHQESFRSQCHFCHQIGSEITRRTRTEEEWSAVFKRMERYGSLFTNENEDDFRKVLRSTFNGEAVIAEQNWQVAKIPSEALYVEWPAGNATSFIHDAEFGLDGLFYGVDMGNDLIHVVDPEKGFVESIPFPESDGPLGGMFSGGVAPLATFNAKFGPHSIQLGPNGKMWMTASLSGSIVSFDPTTREFKNYPIGRDAIYPHTLRFDKQGMLWFTVSLSNQVGRMDIKSGEITLIDLPSSSFWTYMSDAFFPLALKISSYFPKEDVHMSISAHRWNGKGKDIFDLPYGLDVNPVDGSIWYSKLYSSYIGRLDPETLEVTEIKTPLKGPRRLRFDNKGNLWIPSFEESAIMHFDTQTERFEEIALPSLAADEYEVPYALAIHPETQDVWVTSNMSDRIFRYTPSTKTFMHYPSPTRVTYLRDIVFSEEGAVCSANANLPTHSIEGGLPAMLCIYPEGKH